MEIGGRWQRWTREKAQSKQFGGVDMEDPERCERQSAEQRHVMLDLVGSNFVSKSKLG